MDLKEEIVSEIAKAAAAEVVSQQAPSRTQEHKDVATRIIKFILVLTLVEVIGYAYITGHLHTDQSQRIDCNAGTIDHLQHQHIGKNGYKPKPSCR